MILKCCREVSWRVAGDCKGQVQLAQQEKSVNVASLEVRSLLLIRPVSQRLKVLASFGWDRVPEGWGRLAKAIVLKLSRKSKTAPLKSYRIKTDVLYRPGSQEGFQLGGLPQVKAQVLRQLFSQEDSTPVSSQMFLSAWTSAAWPPRLQGPTNLQLQS